MCFISAFAYLDFATIFVIFIFYAVSDYGSIEHTKRKIQENVLKTELKDVSRNPPWQHFVAITNEVDSEKVVMPFVSCIECSSALSYDSSK